MQTNNIDIYNWPQIISISLKWSAQPEEIWTWKVFKGPKQIEQFLG